MYRNEYEPQSPVYVPKIEHRKLEVYGRKENKP